MTKTEWWKTLNSGQRKDLAKELDSSVNALRQVFYGHRNPGINRAREILRASEKLGLGKSLSLSDLRPDVWANDQAA